MEFDINNPLSWVKHQVALDLNRTVLNCCASIFEEEILVRLAARPLLVYPGLQTRHPQHYRMIHPGEVGYDPELPPEDNFDPEQFMKVSGDVPQDDPERVKLETEDGKRPEESLPPHPVDVAFKLAGGIIPAPTWTMHHLYDGNFPFEGMEASFNAPEWSFHQTQAAGLVCVHPIIESLWGDFGAIAKTLRARVWIKFGYDPDHFFSTGEHNERGFDVARLPLLFPER